VSTWETPPSERASANKICTQLHQAYRGLRLYPADHPSARQALDGLAKTVSSHVHECGPLSLQVEETRLVYDEEHVYSFAESRDNLAFLMFRDGIRSFSFHPGLEKAELGSFVDCLAHADDLADIEHDLATAFWEQDFVHIDYQVADPFLGGEVLREGTVDALRDTVLRRLDEVALADELPAEPSGAVLSAVEPMQVDPGSLTLTQTEIEETERTVAESSDALEDFIVVLLEMVCDESQSANDDLALIRSLSAVVDHQLENGNLESLCLVLGRLREFEQQGRCLPGLVESVVGEAVTAQRLGALLERSGQAKEEDAGQVERFLGLVLPGALPAVLELLVATDDRAVRKTLLAALETQEDLSAHIWPLMRDMRWYVVRNAVQLMAGSPDLELPVRLEKLLGHPDARVRREVVRTLDTLESTRSVPGLLKALDDEDSSVRTLAARGLGRHGGSGQQATLLAHLESGGFDTRPAEEVGAFFLAFAALVGEKAVSVLDKFWRRRHLRVRPLSTRLAALQALGTVGSPEAERILKEAARSREAHVRQAAARALQENQGLRARERP
jgi:hypothetical protein